MFNVGSPITQNPNGLNFDISRSLKVKLDGVFGLPVYDFLLEFIVSYS